jgi:DNA-binding LacI/PurR family transcriptional regulator
VPAPRLAYQPRHRHLHRRAIRSPGSARANAGRPPANAEPADPLGRLEDHHAGRGHRLRAIHYRRGSRLTIALLDHSRDFNIPEQRIGRLQAEHLAATGHRRLGYAFPDNPRVHALGQARLDGVRHVCADLGLDDPVVRTVPLDPAPAAEAVQAWRADTPAVTGICAFNDNTALAILAGLRRLHLNAPQDLAVIGVDDIPAARLAAPPLTTVTADQPAIASHLAATINAARTGQPAPRRAGSDIISIIRRDSA